MSLLKPEVSIPTALATAVVVYAIHQNATPTMADVRSAPSGDKNIASSERQASWLSAGIVAGIAHRHRNGQITGEGVDRLGALVEPLLLAGLEHV